jgi:hypothetical protein
MADHYHVADPTGNIVADENGITAFVDPDVASEVAARLGVDIESGLETAVDRCDLQSCATTETWAVA